MSEHLNYGGGFTEEDIKANAIKNSPHLCDEEESFSMSYEDMYGDEWKAIAEAENKAHREEKLSKDRHKQQLKNLCNTRIVWNWLNENEFWKIEGVFDVKIENRHNYYYGKTMPHAKIQHSDYSHLDLHWQKESTKEVGANHIFVEQHCFFEDSYYGNIAIPLKNHKYLLISYSC